MLFSRDFSPLIVNLSFQSTNQIVADLFNDGTANNQSLVDSFQDFVKCLSEFGCNPNYPDVSMAAIELIRRCAKYVSKHQDKFCQSDMIENSDKNDKHDRVWIRGWFPVLFELSCIINSSKLDIRTRSLTILFETVKTYGDSFEDSWWEDLFRVLFR